jgi:hypothetical protein
MQADQPVTGATRACATTADKAECLLSPAHVADLAYFGSPVPANDQVQMEHYVA